MTRKAKAPAQRELGPRGVQLAVIRTYVNLGCEVALTGQSYRRGSRRNPGTSGIPDLYVFPPIRSNVDQHGFWHESKATDGHQRPAQVEWQDRCEARGIGYVLGGVEEALRYLRTIGLLSGGAGVAKHNARARAFFGGSK